MLNAKDSVGQSPLYKLEPQVDPPSAAVLKRLCDDDVKLLEACLTETAECVYDACFEERGIEDTLLGPLPEDAGEPVTNTASCDDSGTEWFIIKPGRRLTTEQEQHLFLLLNYCRYQAMRILASSRGKRLLANPTHELLRWLRITARTRATIVRFNVPLVLAMAKRTKLSGVDYADLVSEGNLALLRSVDKYDCGRGFKFSTYACRAILKAFSRVATRTARYRGYFPTEFDPSLERSDHVEQKRKNMENDCVDELKSILGDNLARLNDVEERVIRARFAMDGELPKPGMKAAKTLEQVGAMIGVTKERVRQIQNKALDKLRQALEHGVLAK